MFILHLPQCDLKFFVTVGEKVDDSKSFACVLARLFLC